jgi:hypothetical protein
MLRIVRPARCAITRSPAARTSREARATAAGGRRPWHLLGATSPEEDPPSRCIPGCGEMGSRRWVIATCTFPSGRAALQRRGSAARSSAMRLVCFGDIHMAFRAIERLGPTLREADWAILTGDLTHFGDPPDALRVVDAVRQSCPNVLAVTGNLDFACGTNSAAHRERTPHNFRGGTVLACAGSAGWFGCGGSRVLARGH